MKQKVKYLLIVLLLLIIIITAILVINKRNQEKEIIEELETNTIVATKTIEDQDMGNYEEEITIEFEDDDKANNIEMVFKFENNEEANNMYALYNFAMTMIEEDYSKGITAVQEENNVIITMDELAYATIQELSEEEMTKENLKKMLEEEGYQVK